MDTVITAIVFCLVLGFLISIHEFGHFMVAKSFGVYCSQFSLGMGPKLLSKKFGETEYELRLLPIGGFVSMAGEVDQEDNEELKDVPFERTLKGIAWWKRILVFFAGPFMNFLSAFVIVFIIFTFTMQVSTNSNKLGSVIENSPAYEAGMIAGDTIQSITSTTTNNQYLIGSFSDLDDALNKTVNGYEGDTHDFNVTVNRNNELVNLLVKAKYNPDTDKYYLGVSSTTRKLTLDESITGTINYCGEISMMIVNTLKKLVTEAKDTVGQLSGPVGIFQATGEATKTGDISTIFLFCSMLSLNLGIFNLLPVPGLDGAQALIVLVEKIIGKELSTKFKLILQICGLALVFGLMIIVTFNDVLRLF